MELAHLRASVDRATSTTEKRLDAQDARIHILEIDYWKRSALIGFLVGLCTFLGAGLLAVIVRAVMTASAP